MTFAGLPKLNRKNRSYEQTNKSIPKRLKNNRYATMKSLSPDIIGRRRTNFGRHMQKQMLINLN